MPKRLSRKFCDSVKPDTKTRTYGAGRGFHGLTFMVKPSGAKSWYQRITINGKPCNIGLGGYPAVGIDEARTKAAQNRTNVLNGEDPRRERRRVAVGIPDGVPTLADCFELVVEARKSGWKNPRKMETQWRGGLDYVATLMARPVADVGAGEALAALGPLMAEKPAVAGYVRARLAEAVNRAILLGLRGDNPFDQIASALVKPKNGTRHHAAMPYAQAPTAIAELVAIDRPNATMLALQILTVVRPGEARGLRWSEIDANGRVWTIPAERMKAKAEHRVPLSGAALALLERAPKHGDLAFRAPRGGAFGDREPTRLIQHLGWDCTGHGFRSTFADWAVETQDASEELVDRCLAHKPKSKVTASYVRTSMLEQRRPLMELWGEYCVGFNRQPESDLHQQSPAGTIGRRASPRRASRPLRPPSQTNSA